MLAAIIIASIIAYVMIGRTISGTAWRVWRLGSPETAAAKFFFPITSRFSPKDFGTHTASERDPPWIGNTNPDSADVALYHWGVAVLWPFRLTWSLVGALIAGLGWVTGAPLRLLAPPAAKSLPAPRDDEPDGPLTPERRYLEADRREREISVQATAARVEKDAAAKALGGDEEAKKLVSMPGRKP